MKIKICAIGECMMELSNAKNALYSQSIAGDTLNFSSYLDKNIFDISYFTAVGTSEISKRVIRFLQKQKIKTNLVSQISSHEIGLYLIENTKAGEKIFYYWRDHSAAKFFFNNENIKKYKNQLEKYQYVYFSGITLSLFENNNFYNFISLLEFLKKKQVKIIFDFNIRINRWTKKNLNNFLYSILNFVDICFVSGEDLKFWKNDSSLRNFEKLINKYKIDHGIFRKNAKLTYSIQNKKKYTIKNKFIRKVVDTSGAGDGFNAAYVSNFIIHNDPALALKEASLLGSKIIMQKGAIVDVK